MTLDVKVVVTDFIFIEVIVVSDRTGLERLTVLEELNTKQVGIDPFAP